MTSLERRQKAEIVRLARALKVLARHGCVLGCDGCQAAANSARIELERHKAWKNRPARKEAEPELLSNPFEALLSTPEGRALARDLIPSRTRPQNS